jgi:hypothetical protein
LHNKEKTRTNHQTKKKSQTSQIQATQNSQELATATQVEKKKDDDIGAKKSIPQNKRFVLGRKKLDLA